MFRRKPDPRPALHLYRRCMRIIQQLEPSFQKTYYDYVRLKYEENNHLTNKHEIQKVVQQAYEEMEWLQTVLDRKKQIGRR